ncbi:hypothetical protein [Marinobacter sp. LN3S78]|uniref:hypothetical protein n=1 Tax=Marinobacter sp. LN3S78 TaxID=3382300 RepID=UPI00387B9CE7
MNRKSRYKALQQRRIGLTTSQRIMKVWGIGESDQERILSIEPGELDSFDALEALTDDQLAKVSYLLNIHASLKELFQNPENRCGFMTAVNHNPPYDGRRPVDFVMTGEVDALKRVFESLERMKHGQW